MLVLRLLQCKLSVTVVTLLVSTVYGHILSVLSIRADLALWTRKET